MKINLNFRRFINDIASKFNRLFTNERNEVLNKETFKIGREKIIVLQAKVNDSSNISNLCLSFLYQQRVGRCVLISKRLW